MSFLGSLEKEIISLKRQKNAIILSHYYQDDEIQDLADFIGDSLELSRKAAQTDAEIIVFCGVKFMAEVAKILNPSKKVLLPDMNAGCSLEESCKASDLKKLIDSVENPFVVTYINSSIEVKAISDVVCTSSSGEKIVKNVPKEKNIIFGPDKYLGRYIAKKTGRNLILWDGSCLVHENFSERNVIELKTFHSGAVVIAHPECTDNLIKYADFVGSTSQLLNYVKISGRKEFIVLTEPGIIHQMKKILPDGIYHQVQLTGASGECNLCSKCPYMRLNTIEKLHHCMLKEEPEIKLDAELISSAKISLDNMFKMCE